jgi:hypothetical protein
MSRNSIDIQSATTNAPLQWVKQFNQKHGRSPRVLHIGNIANNAYNNAKLLNNAGLDCDVLCYDYYHIMGCPEWEDADFIGSVRDHFFPNWHSLEMNQFQRPLWFAQGPTKLCIRYLLSRRQNDLKIASSLWNQLESYRGFRTSLIGHYAYKSFFFLKKAKPYVQPILDLYNYTKSQIKRCFINKYTLPYLRKYFPQLNPSIESSKSLFEERIEELIKIFKVNFPERSDQLLAADLIPYKSIISLWNELFDQYDIIQAYSTDPILPLLAGKKYFAFEHGTLREIPFYPNTQGRITAISYSEAQHVFVTNSDCLENAYYLAGKRVSYINHPYDENHGNDISGVEDLCSHLCKQLDADFLFFFPTRHDWVTGTGYADKSNDIFLRAFCQLRQSGYRVGMVCCRWGKNVQESIHLLKDNQCDKHVLWQEPMGTVQFERTVKACDVVVDQFKLGSFGGIMFKAMAVGTVICTYLNEAEILNQYQELPPIINCQTEVQIVQAVQELINHPENINHLSLSAKQWIDKYHSSSLTVQTQLQQYKLLLMPD